MTPDELEELAIRLNEVVPGLVMQTRKAWYSAPSMWLAQSGDPTNPTCTPTELVASIMYARCRMYLKNDLKRGSPLPDDSMAIVLYAISKLEECISNDMFSDDTPGSMARLASQTPLPKAKNFG